MLLPSRNTSCASFSVLAPGRAARASRSPDPKLRGHSVNQPARATEEARELLVGERGVADDHVADCLVRPRGACLLHKPNPHHFRCGVLDFKVVTHSPRKRGRVFGLQIRWRSSKVGKLHQHWEIGGASPETG